MQPGIQMMQKIGQQKNYGIHFGQQKVNHFKTKFKKKSTIQKKDLTKKQRRQKKSLKRKKRYYGSKQEVMIGMSQAKKKNEQKRIMKKQNKITKNLQEENGMITIGRKTGKRDLKIFQENQLIQMTAMKFQVFLAIPNFQK